MKALTISSVLIFTLFASQAEAAYLGKRGKCKHGSKNHYGQNPVPSRTASPATVVGPQTQNKPSTETPHGSVNNTTGNTKAAGKFDYITDYGVKNFVDNKDGSFVFNIYPPSGQEKDGQGTRIRSKTTASSGKVCADIKSFSTEADAAVFAFYLGQDKIPETTEARNTEAWHEIDFEFRNKYPLDYWSNLYYGTLKETGGDVRGVSKPLADGKAVNTNFNKYCIEWGGKGDARWTINNIEVRKESTGIPWKPMHVFISIWAAETGGWAGDMIKFTKATKSEIKNIEFVSKN